jgi:hypothetical protein
MALAAQPYGLSSHLTMATPRRWHSGAITVMHMQLRRQGAVRWALDICASPCAYVASFTVTSAAAPDSRGGGHSSLGSLLQWLFHVARGGTVAASVTSQAQKLNTCYTAASAAGFCKSLIATVGTGDGSCSGGSGGSTTQRETGGEGRQAASATVAIRRREAWSGGCWIVHAKVERRRVPAAADGAHACAAAGGAGGSVGECCSLQWLPSMLV